MMNILDKHTMFLVQNWNSPEIMTCAEITEERHWWNIFKLDEEQKKTLNTMVQYVMEGVDDLVILAIREMKEAGIDILDKNKVVECVGALYDAVVTLPSWAKLFASPIRNAVVNTIVPVFVEFLYNKYTKASQPNT